MAKRIKPQPVKTKDEALEIIDNGVPAAAARFNGSRP